MLAIFWIALVAVGAWYVVTHLPRARDEPTLFARDETAWPVCSTGCGRERWLQKTLADPARSAVDLTHVVNITVAQLTALDPRSSTVMGGWRWAPIETTVYRVDATLVALLGEEDHDFHLVLADRDHPGVTMIAEIPDPDCASACTSGFASYFSRARRVLMEHTNSPTLSRLRPRVRVTGVGFLDRAHGQSGAARNGVELHPVLVVEFP